MKPKAIRLPDDILDVVGYAVRKEKLEESTALRKFLRLGAEKYVADLYARGELTLREAAGILGMKTREVLELFWDMGIPGNTDAAETLKAISVLKKYQEP